MMIGETASTEHGGSKAEWISQMLPQLPKLPQDPRGLIWFDKAEDSDWPIESSPSSEAAFARGVGNERFAAANPKGSARARSHPLRRFGWTDDLVEMHP